METKKTKRMIVLSIVTTFLLVVGVSYAYFTARLNTEGDNNTTVEAAQLASANLKYGGTIEANGKLPGYKTVKTVNVQGKGSSSAKPIVAYLELMPDVADFENHVKYSIYEVEGDNTIDANNICGESQDTGENNQYYDAMECDTTGLGNVIASGTFVDKKRVIQEIPIAYNTNKTYYIVVEYVNDLEKPQDSEQGKSFIISFNASTDIKKTLIEHITNLAISSEEVVDDETEDHNLRYIGANPNNYVSFNNELWRIIGGMNNIEDENGEVSLRVKIIRNDILGEYTWDNKNIRGINDWSVSELQKVLNEGAYYTRAVGKCPYGENGGTKDCDFTTIGLLPESKKMISKVKWNLGGSNHDNITSKIFYENERGITTIDNHDTIWVGNVGLMYPSDYGFATGGGETTNRNSCLNTALQNWEGNEVSDCKNNDWLYVQDNVQWTITPSSSYNNYVFYVKAAGSISYYSHPFNPITVRPVVYLNTDIKIKSGIGSINDPYILD